MFRTGVGDDTHCLDEYCDYFARATLVYGEWCRRFGMKHTDAENMAMLFQRTYVIYTIVLAPFRTPP